MFPHPPKGYPPFPHNMRREIESEIVVAAECHHAEYFERLLASKSRTVQAVQLKGLGLGQRWVEAGRRVVFPSQEIVKACQHTSALKQVMCGDLRTIHPAIMFYFPREPRHHITETEFLYAALVSILEAPLVTKLNGREFMMLFDARRYFMASFFWMKDGGGSMWGMNLPDEKSLDFMINDAESNVVGETALPVPAQTVCGRLMEMIVNFLLLMQSYPQYITKFETKAREVGGTKARKLDAYKLALPSNLRRTIMVGQHHSKTHAEGEPTSRSPHWRMGHWRRQPHGPFFETTNPKVAIIVVGEQRFHMKWIMPLFIAGQPKGTE